MMRLEDVRGVRKKNDVMLPPQIDKDAKRFLIATDVAQGLTYTQIVKKYMAEWGLAQSTVQQIVNETLRYMRSDDAKEAITAMNMERLDNIITDSIKDGDRGSAIKGIDTQNKMNQVYKEQVKIEGDSEINLIFDI